MVVEGFYEDGYVEHGLDGIAPVLRLMRPRVSRGPCFKDEKEQARPEQSSGRGRELRFF
jgi:hypothetical protein